MESFNHCTALITGASSGIGREMALQLAPLAHTLILVARRSDRLAILREELLHINPQLVVDCKKVDLSDETAVEKLGHELLSRDVQVELLVNNAGLGDHGSFYNSGWSRVRDMLEVNIKALTALTRTLLPSMIASGYGSVLNVSSIASLLPVPDMAVYAATKAYVTSFSEGIRAELRGTGVTVTTVCPGPVATEFFDLAERGEASGISTPSALRVPVEQVAEEALNAVLNDRARVIPGWQVCLAVGLITALPMFALRFFLEKRAGR